MPIDTQDRKSIEIQAGLLAKAGPMDPFRAAKLQS